MRLNWSVADKKLLKSWQDSKSNHWTIREVANRFIFMSVFAHYPCKFVSIVGGDCSPLPKSRLNEKLLFALFFLHQFKRKWFFLFHRWFFSVVAIWMWARVLPYTNSLELWVFADSTHREKKIMLNTRMTCKECKDKLVHEQQSGAEKNLIQSEIKSFG